MPSITSDILDLGNFAHMPLVHQAKLQSVLDRMNYNDMYDQASPPSVADDIEDGFKKGTRWTTTSGSIYVCMSNVSGAAVWTFISGSGD